MHLGLQLKGVVLTAAFISIHLVGCTPDKSGRFESGQPVGVIDTTQTPGLNIVGEDLQPLAGAKILIGQDLNDPFLNNYMVADSSGHVDLPSGWQDAQTVTIEAPNYIRASYFAQTPADRTYRLRKKRSTLINQYELKGLTTGHDITDRDGLVDFSLVIPAMTRNDFLSFNVSTVISPQNDKISIMGQEVGIPSNVTLPKQKESYVIPVNFDKPNYRIYFGDGGTQKVFSARGRFPLKKVVDKLRNNDPFYELMNDFVISGGGVKDLNLTTSSTDADLSVKDLDFKNKVDVTAPTIDSDETLMVVGVAHMAEYMLPTDVKLIKSGEKLGITTLDTKGSVFSILKKTKDMDSNDPAAERLSAVLMPALLGVSPKFLPIMQDPTLTSNGDMLVPKIHPVAGVNPVATYAVISQVENLPQGAKKVKVNNSYWEMYAPHWMEVVSLPRWPEGNHMAGKKHWEINLVGSLTVSQVDLGPAMINNATHVTHSSLDF
ncbi:MAG TPA: hypothetical protein VIG33_08530 [Pseudobdellovibrionaceae bacterium]|jgi:hypothetical protein